MAFVLALSLAVVTGARRPWARAIALLFAAAAIVATFLPPIAAYPLAHRRAAFVLPQREPGQLGQACCSVRLWRRRARGPFVGEPAFA